MFLAVTLFELTVVNNWFIIMVRTELFREKCNDSDFLLTLKNGFRSKKMKTCIIISRSDEISLFIMSQARDKEN